MLNYPNGPWQKLFEGSFDKYPLRLLYNEDGFVITEILNTDKTMAAVNVSKIFSVFGDVEAFIETMPKSCLFVMIHTVNQTNKFVFLTQPPQVINVDDKEAKEMLKRQISILEKNAKIMKDIAEAYDLKFLSFKDTSKEAKKALFTNPAVFSMLVKALKPMELKVEPIETTPLEKLIFLGFHKATGNEAKEPFSSFVKTCVIYGTHESTKEQMLRIIAEEFALNDRNVVFFSYNSLEAIKHPNPNENEVKTKLGIEPTGFPLSTYSLEKGNLFVDLSLLPPEAITNLYDLGENKVSKVIEKCMLEKPKTLKELIEKIDLMTPTEELIKYDILTAVRVLKTIEQIHPNLYAGKMNLDEFLKPWSKKIGRIIAVTLKKDDKVAAKVIIHNLLTQLKDAQNIGIIIPMAHEFLHRNNHDSLEKEMIELIKKSNVAIFLAAPNEIDIEKEIIDNSTIIQIVAPKDVAIKIKDSKPYRIEPRPTMSEFVSKEGG